MTWIALHEEVSDFQAVLEGVSIFGHQTWKLFNDTKVLTRLAVDRDKLRNQTRVNRDEPRNLEFRLLLWTEDDSG